MISLQHGFASMKSPYELARLAAIVSLLASPLSAADQPSPQAATIPMTGHTNPALAPIDDLLTNFLRERKIPGAAVAVSRQGRLVYSRGFGYSDREEKLAVEPEALFRIASISKPITAIAVLQLVERGKLRLDDRIVDVLSLPGNGKVIWNFDDRWRNVTIRHLLEHTSGWDRDKSFDTMFRPILIARTLGTTAPAGPHDVIRYMLGIPFDFEPGERYAYSNFGYCLLGRAIEKLSGETYENYVRAHVLGPLGITRMRLGKTLLSGRAGGEVKYYAEDDETGPAVVGATLDEKVPLPYGAWYLEAMDSHGGWIAPAVDLVKFASAFDDPEHSPLLRRETIAEMFARPAGLAGYEADGKPRDVFYGLGWQVRLAGDNGRTNQWHTGSLDGTSTILVRRHDGFNWAILFNTRNGSKENVPSRAIDPLFHKAVNSVREWPAGEPLRSDQTK